MKRLGIFGGTFDPIHNGHLLLAEMCYGQCSLDEIWFVVAARSPFKQEQSCAPDADRMAMVQLAIAAHQGFRPSAIEIDRGGVSFTIDTLRDVRAERPDDVLFLLLGADAFRDLPNWREAHEVCRLAQPVVVCRPGEEAPKSEILAPLVASQSPLSLRPHIVQMPLIGISSTDLRHRVAEQQSIRFQTPRAVEEYIAVHNLYNTSATRRK